MKINKYEINFSKKDLDEQYKKFLDTQKNFKKIEKNREIIKSDRVTINFQTNNSNVPEYLKSQKNIPIDTSIQQEILPGINNLLISKKLKQAENKNLFFNFSKLIKNDKFKKVNTTLRLFLLKRVLSLKLMMSI